MKNRRISAGSTLWLWLGLLSLPSLLAAQTITLDQDTQVASGETLYAGQDLIVDGVTLIIDGAHHFASLQLINGAQLTHSEAASEKLDLEIAGRFMIDATSKIDISGKGYLASDAVGDYSGGSYGGQGGTYRDNRSNASYGDRQQPLDFGMGGRKTGNEINRGGGAIKIQADILELSGQILAHGEAPEGHKDHPHSSWGTGSGGSIWLDVGLLKGDPAGLARIAANGGDTAYDDGTGSGGRIALYYTQSEHFEVLAQITASGAYSHHRDAKAGSAGTIYLQKDHTEAILHINNHGANLDRQAASELSGNIPARLQIAYATIHQVGETQVNAIVGTQNTAEWMTHQHLLRISEDILNVDGFILSLGRNHHYNAINLINGGIISSRLPADTDTQGYTLSADNIYIDATSKIDVSGKGHLASDAVGDYSGGSYGGNGGTYQGNTSNAPYGEITQPLDFGMGGRQSGNNVNRGGGAIKIQANTLELWGHILAHGDAPDGHKDHPHSSWGTGSGGSIWLEVGLLKGDPNGQARIAANGGDTAYDDGTGSGGRIALYYRQTEHFDVLEQITATGAYSHHRHAQAGSAGSIYLQKAHEDAILHIDNQGANPDRQALSDISGTLSAWVHIEHAVLQQRGPTQVKGIISAENSATWITGRHQLSFPDQVLNVDGLVLTLGRDQTYSTVNVINGGMISTTLPADTDTQGYILSADHIYIDATSKIDVSGKGYAASEAVGDYSGGSYGGQGGTYQGNTTNAPYGDRLQPRDFGMGGRKTGTQINRGGGAIKIQANILELRGHILAHGDAPEGHKDHPLSSWGTGSGGSIWLDVGLLKGDIAGQARIAANGGDSAYDDGTGSGGRIAIEYASTQDFHLNQQVQARGPESHHRDASNGEPGSIYTHYRPLAPLIVSTNAQGSYDYSPHHLTFRFADRIDLDSLDLADITLTGPTGAVNLTELSQTGDQSYQVRVPQPLPDGDYTLRIGPQIQSRHAVRMDQDRDGHFGEADDDQFRSSFVIDTRIPAPVTLSSHPLGDVLHIRQNAINLSGTRQDSSRVLINGVEVLPLGSGDWQLSDYPLPEGLNTLRLQVVDQAGHQSAELIVEVFVDSLAPQINQYAPVGALTAQPTEIVVDFSENHQIAAYLSQIQVLYQGEVLFSGGYREGEQWKLALNDPLATGFYQVQVQLSDQAGNLTREAFSFYYLAPDDYQQIHPVGPGRAYAEVQSAIDAAAEGDLILIEPGEYFGSIHLNKRVHLKGHSSDPSQVILAQNDGPDNTPDTGTVNLHFEHPSPDLDHPLIIEGLTIRAHETHPWQAALSIANNHQPLILSQVKLHTAHANSYVIDGPQENSGQAPFFIQHSQLAKGYRHFIHLNTPQSYLIQSLLDSEMDTADSAYAVKYRDYVSTPSTAYGPAYGPDLLTLTPALWISSSSVEQSPLAAIEHIQVQFSRNLDRNSFSLDDVSLSGPGNPQLSHIETLSDTHYRIHLAHSLASGTYVFTLGAQITDSDGRFMDQNQNRIGGESQDSYQISFTIDNDNPLQPTLNDYGLAPQVNRVHTTSIQLSGSREADTAIYLNDTPYLSYGDADWQVDEIPLTEGENHLTVFAEDRAGNRSTPYTVIFSVDTHAPVIDSISPQGHTTEAPQHIHIAYSDTGSTIDLNRSILSLIDSQNRPIHGTATDDNGQIQWAWATPLSDETYTLTVQLADSHGNLSASQQMSLVVDTQAPAAPIIAELPSVSQMQTLRVQGTKEADAQILLDGERIISENGPDWHYHLNLQAGENTFRFSQQDAAGHLSADTLVHIYFDNVAPGPVSLNSQGAGDGQQMQLDWRHYDEFNQGADIAHYAIYLSDTPFNTINDLSPIAQIPAGTQQTTLNHLNLDAHYYVAVVAVDQAGNHDPAVSPNAVTISDIIAPSLESTLSVQAQSEQLHLHWRDDNPATDLSHYQLRLNQQAALHIAAGTHRHTFSGLSQSSGYDIELRAVDQSGNLSPAIHLSAATIMDNPRDLAAEVATGRVQLTWSAPANQHLIDHYLVYVSETPITTLTGLTPRLHLYGPETSTVIAGLKNGQDYYFALSTVNISAAQNTQVQSLKVHTTPQNTSPQIEHLQLGATPLVDGMVLSQPGILQLSSTPSHGLSRVQYFLDNQLLGSGNLATPAAEYFWNIAAHSDGEHQLKVILRDSLSQQSEMSYTLQLALAAPQEPPQISSPQAGQSTQQAQAILEIVTPAHGQVQVYRNGHPLGAPLTTDAHGQRQIPVSLLSGANAFTATALNRAGSSPASPAIHITYQDTVLAAPSGLIAQARLDGLVELSWQASTDPSVQGYHLYRSESAFTHPADAQRVNNELILSTQFEDLPLQDGRYYYRLSRVNQLGNESALSSQVTATADSTPPQATLVEYLSDGLVDPDSGALAAGHVTLNVHVSEPLLTTPFLSLISESGVPKLIVLKKITALHYQGAFDIQPDTPSGVAEMIFSARDVLGNRGTEILAGRQLRIDSDGPTVLALSLTPPAPIHYRPEDGAQAPTLVVDLTLEAAVKAGTPVQLHYLLSGPGREAVAITDFVAADDTHYRGRFQLPADAGRDAVESLSFILTAVDNLDNPAEPMGVTNHFQIYQGALPPLAIPRYLDAQALPAGQVQLNWEAVDGAAEYAIYRQGPLTANAPLDNDAWIALPRSTAAGELDTPPSDGEYAYQVSSIRQANQQEGESAASEPVRVHSDGTPPAAPTDLTLELIAPGIQGQWTPISSEPVRYRVYRARQAPITDVSGLTPLYEHLGEGHFVDTHPSTTEHAYVITAVDAVGNESPPSETQYENFGLLPVRELHVLQTAGHAPVIHWVHQGADIIGFELSLLNPLDGEASSTTLHAGLWPSDNWTDDAFVGDSRYYQVVAVDAQQARSLARRILLPALRITPLDSHLQRGILNVLRVAVENRSAYPLESLRVVTEVQGIAHQSQTAVSLAAGATATLAVVIGGYPDLAAQETLTHSVIIAPPHLGDSPTESVTLRQTQTVTVDQARMALRVEATNLTRGAQGTVRFILENPSDRAVDVVVARDQHRQDSDEIRIQLYDHDDNLLATYPFRQTVGENVLTLSHGTTVLRIPPGATVSSAPLTIAVPDTPISEGVIRLSIDAFHYHHGEAEAVQIPGLSRDQAVSLDASPYYAQIDHLSPTLSYGDEDIVITGQAFQRSDDSPQADAPLMLYLRSQGFERRAEVLTDANGQFHYTFTPLAGESGHYTVSVLHPSEHSRPVHGEFTLQQAHLSPQIYNLSLPRNQTHTLQLSVEAGKALALHQVHLAYQESDQSAGKPAGISLSLPSPVDIAAQQSAQLAITFRANGHAPKQGSLVLRVNSAEYHPDNPDNPHSIGLFTLNYQLVASLPSLKVTPQYLETGLAQKQSLTETLTLHNQGLGDLNDIHLSLRNEQEQPLGPSWIHLITPNVIAQLAPGQSTAVRLGIHPSAQISDAVYPFILRVESANHPTRDIHLYVSVTQSGEGEVLFQVSDIYTWTLDANQQRIEGLQGARLKLENELVPGVEFTLYTDANGEAWFDSVPPGFYRYRATASNHRESSGRLTIKPGVTLKQEVFLDYQLIAVQWEVNEIVLQDRYEIVLHSVYETHVPAAVVVAEPASVTLPSMQPGQVYHGEFKLINHGLIRADNIQIALPPDDPYFKYELMQHIPPSIAAQSNITIPYRITALQPLAEIASHRRDASGGGCHSYIQCFTVEYQYMCTNGTESPGQVGYCTTSVNGQCSPDEAVESVQQNPIVNESVGGGAFSRDTGVSVTNQASELDGTFCSPETDGDGDCGGAGNGGG